MGFCALGTGFMKEKQQKNGNGISIRAIDRLELWDLSWDLKKKKQFAGKWDQDPPPPRPPSGPSVEEQKQQMIKLRNLGGADKFFKQIGQHWGIFTTSEIIYSSS